MPTWRSILAVPAVVFAVVQLWMWGLHGIDVSAMSDVGLVSVLRPPAYLALAVLTVSFMVTLFGRRPTGARLASHIVVLIGLLHATPSLLYGTLRYSWAWKHLAIVDYISRTNHVSSTIATHPAYHNWPGFFSFSALLSKLTGLHDASAIALWAPPIFNLLTFGALLFLYRTLTKDARVIWVACWLFFVSNWIGQDYFSPQAMAFVLYLVTIAVVIDRYVRSERSTPDAPQARAITVTIVLCTLAIVTSHQLTPIMLIAALSALSLARLAKVGRFALFAALANLAWYATGARAFVGAQLAPTLKAFGAIFGNAEGSLHDTELESHGQIIVSMMGRMTVVALATVAVVGFARRWRRGTRDLVPAVLCVMPASFIVLNDYGGEIVFRVFLFACPFLAYFAGQALVTRRCVRPAGARSADGAGDLAGIRVRASARDWRRSTIAVAATTSTNASFAAGGAAGDRPEPVHVVTSREAWDLYRRTASVVCPPGRGARPATFVAFIVGNELQRELPRVVAVRRRVVLFDATEESRLRASHNELDVRLADVIGVAREMGLEGVPRQVYLLTSPGEPGHVRLPSTVAVRRSWPWLLGRWRVRHGASAERVRREVSRRWRAGRPRRYLAPIIVSAILTSGFLFGYYGKDRQYHFSREEVAATKFLIDHATDRTLLVSATANYPNIDRGYERFTPVIINTEDLVSRDHVMADPAGVLSDWLADSRYSRAFLLLTRSQGAEINAVGVLPVGSVAKIMSAVGQSPRFKMVFATRDATIFQLADEAPA